MKSKIKMQKLGVDTQLETQKTNQMIALEVDFQKQKLKGFTLVEFQWKSKSKEKTDLKQTKTKTNQSRNKSKTNPKTKHIKAKTNPKQI